MRREGETVPQRWEQLLVRDSSDRIHPSTTTQISVEPAFFKDYASSYCFSQKLPEKTSETPSASSKPRRIAHTCRATLQGTGLRDTTLQQEQVDPHKGGRARGGRQHYKVPQIRSSLLCLLHEGFRASLRRHVH